MTPASHPLAGADIDGMIAASTVANARVARLQGVHDRMVAGMKQEAERIAAAMDVDDQLLVDHQALADALEIAASAALGELRHEADVEAAACAETVDDLVRETEAHQPAHFPCEVTA